MDGIGVSGAEDELAAAEDRRLEELLRVNAELAAEIRSLAAGRHPAPRAGELPTARRLAKLTAERDGAVAEASALREERDRLLVEVRRLRGGWAGFLRRARARILRS